MRLTYSSKFTLQYVMYHNITVRYLLVSLGCAKEVYFQAKGGGGGGGGGAAKNSSNSFFAYRICFSST